MLSELGPPQTDERRIDGPGSGGSGFFGRAISFPLDQVLPTRKYYVNGLYLPGPRIDV